MPEAPIPVFDIGQVLVRWDPKRGLARHFADETAIERFMAEIDFARWHAQQDAGRSVEVAVADLAGRFPHHRAAITGFYADWLDSIPGEVEGTRAIFEGLARRGPVYGISNFSRELFDRTVPAYPFLADFTGLVLSGDVGINKPDPRIYRILCQRHGLTPGACIFIDDSGRNVEAARAEGMDALLFTDAASLSDDLRARGLNW
ncbi:HAD family hydrolase [Phreatobacter sp.]|uniref:HAD family hydrolase n=1 Tax=Phreatobacter sp. TaxID=1966341 RepID=UPI003F71C1C8